MFEPKKIGEIISDAADMLRQNFWVFVLASLPLCVFEFLSREGASIFSAKLMKVIDPERAAQGGEVMWAELTTPLIGMPLAYLLQMLFSSLIYAVGIAGAVMIFKGQKPIRGDMWKRASAKALPLMLTLVIMFVLMMLVMVVVPALLIVGAAFAESTLLIVVASVLSFAWVLVTALWLVLRWLLVTHSVVLENKWGLAALSRSAQLLGPKGVPFMQSPKVRLAFLLLIFMLISSTLQSVFILPQMIAGFSQTPPFSDLSVLSLPIPIAVFVAIGQILSGAVVYPFSAAMTTSFYFDTRVRYEGFDEADLHA